MNTLTPEDVLYKMLHGDEEIEGIVGAEIYPSVSENNEAQHWITYHRVSNLRVSSHEGFDGLSETRYQLNAWSTDAAIRKQLREAMFRVLDGKDVEVEGTRVVIQHEMDMDVMENGPPKRYGAQIDFKVWI